MLKKMPVILVALIALIALVDSLLPISFKSALFALSLTVKSLIIFVLPVIIFLLLFKTISQLSKNATKVVLCILGGVCLSNFLSTMISYKIASALYALDITVSLSLQSSGLAPLWDICLPKLVANDVAMFSGLILGLLLPRLLPSRTAFFAKISESIVRVLLKAITTIVPLFIAGFMVKLVNDKVLQTIIENYAKIFCIIALSAYGYILFVFLAAQRFRFSAFIQSVKNMIPAAISGFCSMSSAASMPLTIIAAEKNAKNGDLAKVAIPTTVNIHLVGDCFSIPIFAFAILASFGMPEPTVGTYLLFAGYFVLAKFSVAAIPGGGILVMLPLLEGYLGFTPEMASLITALYILFDPVITSANVFGNGAFSLVTDRIQDVFSNKRSTIADSGS